MAARAFTRFIALAGLLLGAGSAFAQLRIVTWNVTNYSASSTGRNVDFQTSIYGVVPAGLALAGRSMSPDAFVGQEFISATAVANFLSMLNTAPGSPGDWAQATFVDGADTDNAFFYRTSRVQLVGSTLIAAGSSNTCNQPRNTMRYDVRPTGYAAASATIGIYSSHMKAQGSNTACPAGENAAGRRLIECQRIRDNAEGIDTHNPGSGLPPGYAFMLVGDFNIQSSNSTEYQELIGSQANNAGRLFDPINSPGSWNNSGTYRWVHTQDPVMQVDDRFDLILVSASLIDGGALEYIGDPTLSYNSIATFRGTWNLPEHSYRCWGQDGGSFDAILRTTGNTMVGPVIAQALIDTAAGGGHLPVFADFRVPAKVTSPSTVNFGQVQINAPASQMMGVGNAGDTGAWTTSGIDTLNYTLAASAGFTAPGGSFLDAPGGGGNSHTITMNTSTLGVKSGTLTITSDDPDQPTRVVMLTGEVVLPPNTPPIAHAGPDQSLADTNLSGDEPVTLDGSASNDPDGTIVEYRWTEGPTILATSASPTSMVTLGVGAHTIQLQVTDNRNGTATDEVLITIEPGTPACVADVDDGSGTGTPDGGVTIDDFLYYLFIFENGMIEADVDDGSGTGTPDGGVTIDDLLYFLFRFESGC